MSGMILSPALRANQEFQSASIRLGLWCFMLSFIGYARYQGYFDADWDLLLVLFALHLVWFAGIFVSVLTNPEPSPPRRYLSALSDMSGTSFLIWVMGDPLSPFYLLYIWSFVSQGTRYGSRHLIVAAVASVVSYSIVLFVLDGWGERSFEVAFLLLLLIVLPLYEYVLLKRLHEARNSAEEANQARANFLATMTHELRTPLSAVIGMARLLRDTPLNREQREYVQAIHSSADVLQHVVGDILDLSKIDAHKLDMGRDWFDLREALYEVVASQGAEAALKGLEIVCRIDPKVPARALGDELRFRQILLNLVSNAIKFTNHGQVCVYVHLSPLDVPVPPCLDIVVEDTGIGMSHEQLGRIFEGFWQADRSTTRLHGGTGLGTTIARELTELMGGQISVRSHQGEGTNFRVRLPILSPDAEGLQPPEPPSGLAGRRVLLAEQRALSREVLVDVLAQAGMVVIDWDEAQADDCDILLVDLPEQFADVLARVEARQQSHPCPVVYLRAAGVPLHHVPGTDYAVLSRPPSPVQLWQTMAGLLDGTRPQAHPAMPAQGATGTAAARVLVAEDDEINARLIQALLEKSGHAVTLVIDGAQALSLAAKDHFDIALIDLRMPVMDGLDFCRALREREGSGRHLPVVALTANASEDVRVDCLEAGMDDFIAKPVDPELLARVIAEYSQS